MGGERDVVLAVDQGTGSSKALLLDGAGAVVASGVAPLRQQHPAPAWVEQDPDALWRSVQDCVAACLADAPDARVVGVGLSVQRETVVLWERSTGTPVGPALSWQDQRTADLAAGLHREGHGERVRHVSGLPLDPMFSALKARWLLDEHDPDRTRAEAGELCAGTIDAWILSRLGGEPVVEIGNASRTQLLDVDTGRWSDELCSVFGVPASVLPEVVGSTGPFPVVRDLPGVPDGTPVLAVMADSHSALFAHAGWRPGVVKATYGTGSSVMALGEATSRDGGAVSTIAWQVDAPQPAVEANIRSTGRTLTWLADLFGCTVDDLLADARDAASDGVVVVPAFGGLGAPWWDRDAVATVSRLTLGTRRAQVARAAVESIALQVDDCVVDFEQHVGPLSLLAADGGMTRSRDVMQLQADVSGCRVQVPRTADLSAVGVAHLAGVGLGWWSLDDLARRADDAAEATLVEPRVDDAWRARLRGGWHRELARARGLGEPRS